MPVDLALSNPIQPVHVYHVPSRLEPKAIYCNMAYVKLHEKIGNKSAL